MSCCDNTISNSVNICVDPRRIRNCSTLRVNIPLNLCKNLRIIGEVINNCNGLGVPYASLKLLQKNPCTGCYRCIAQTCANFQGIYRFNLKLNRHSSCCMYKIVASVPYNGYQPTPLYSTPYYSGCCPQEETSFQNNCRCGCPYAQDGINTNEYMNDDYSSDTTCGDSGCQSSYCGCDQGSCMNNRQCDYDYNNVQELQDGCPNQNCGYMQNVCTQTQGGCCSNSQCNMSNFWND